MKTYIKKGVIMKRREFIKNSAVFGTATYFGLLGGALNLNANS